MDGRRITESLLEYRCGILDAQNIQRLFKSANE